MTALPRRLSTLVLLLAALSVVVGAMSSVALAGPNATSIAGLVTATTPGAGSTYTYTATANSPSPMAELAAVSGSARPSNVGHLGGATGSSPTSPAALVAAETGPAALEAGSRVAPRAGTSLSRVTQTEETMYRVWGGESGQAGEWLTPIDPMSSAAARQGLALPGGNTAEYVSRASLFQLAPESRLAPPERHSASLAAGRRSSYFSAFPAPTSARGCRSDHERIHHL